MSREYIAQTLKRLRANTELTADQVGNMIGKSGKTVNAWENNRGQPDADTLLLLCDIYGVDDIRCEFKQDEVNNRIEIDKISMEYLEMFNQLHDVDKGRILNEMKNILQSSDYITFSEAQNS